MKNCAKNSPPPDLANLEKVLLDKVTRLNKYIKYNRMYRLDNTASLTREDLMMLKSLGYVE